MDNVATLIRDGKLDEAQNHLNQNENQAVGSAEWNYLRGLLHEAKGEPQGAIDSFTKAVDIDDSHTEATFRLAFNLDLYGEDDAAMELYEILADQTPTHVNALLNLAVLHEDIGQYEDAHHCIERIVEEYPNHARARLFLKDIENSMSMQYDENYERNMAKQNALLETPVSDFELSVRSRNCLKKMNIHSLGDLLRISEPELLGYKNFGETSLNEIKAMLTQKALRLGQLADEARRSGQPSLAARRLAPDAPPEILNRPLSEIELSGRSRKCLQRLNLNSIGDLIQKSETELLSAKNFGQTSLNEIKTRLEELGVSLRSS